MKKIILSFAAIVFFIMAVSAYSATIYVTNLDDSGPGSLRQAVIDAGSGDNIEFSVTGTIVLLSEIEIAKNFSVFINTDEVDGVILSGNNTNHVFLFRYGTYVINNLTFINGHDPNYSGGAIRVQPQNSLYVMNLTLNQCSFYDNYSNFTGGAITIWYESTVTINNSVFFDNSGPSNGGAISNTGNLYINNTTFTNNTTNAHGGAVLNFESGILRIEHCTITENTGSFGGGIKTYSTISGNCVIKNSIIQGNFSSNNYNDIHTVAGGVITSEGYNIIGTTNGGTLDGDMTGNIIGQSALLMPLQDNGGPTFTMLPGFGSPAYNASGPTSLTEDQRGISRAFSTIGAVDIQHLVSVITNPITNIAENTANSGGSVTGGDPVYNRGLVWSTNSNPEFLTADGSTQDGTGNGSFNSIITLLNPGVKYYVRAYGQALDESYHYGNQRVFTTIPTLGEWGLIVLGTLLAAFGAFRVYRISS